MNNTTEFLVKKKNNKIRLDVFLSNEISKFTRSHIKKLIKKRCVKLNGITHSFASTKIKTNDKIIISIAENEETKLIPYKKTLDIVYEDKDLIVINKPKGMVVHPGPGNTKKTLVNALIHKYKNNLSDVNGVSRPGIIHRIDKDTSGLLVVAKNNLSHSNLGKQFSEHSIKRKYLCLVWGVVRPLNGRIETLITRNKKNRQLMSISEVNGKKAITNYRTLKVFNIKDIPKISFLECELETGRTHQIRVHLKYKGASILGDRQYGKKNIKFKKINKRFFTLLSDLDGQALHAQSLGFNHPTKKKIVNFESNLPLQFKKILNLLENLSG